MKLHVFCRAHPENWSHSSRPRDFQCLLYHVVRQARTGESVNDVPKKEVAYIIADALIFIREAGDLESISDVGTVRELTEFGLCVEIMLWLEVINVYMLKVPNRSFFSSSGFLFACGLLFSF